MKHKTEPHSNTAKRIMRKNVQRKESNTRKLRRYALFFFKIMVQIRFIGEC